MLTCTTHARKLADEKLLVITQIPKHPQSKSSSLSEATSKLLHARAQAGVVKMADALDMERGRARIPYEAGRINIHSVSALAIEKVSIEEGLKKPINIRIEMSNPAGIFQVDNLFANKIRESGLEEYIDVEVIVGEGKARFTLDESKFRLEAICVYDRPDHSAPNGLTEHACSSPEGFERITSWRCHPQNPFFLSFLKD